MRKLLTFFELIKFEHTLFALPFAFLGAILSTSTWPRISEWVWITLGMASARTAGMTLNRIVDFEFDMKNPRTRHRPLGKRGISFRAAWFAAFLSAFIFFYSAYRLNRLCLILSPVAFFLFCTYHFVKRFSFLSHFAIGLVLACAPMAGWLGVTGEWSWKPVPLALAVFFWVSGFDILYSLQDLSFDKAHGLHSIPVSFGVEKSIYFSRILHLLTYASLLSAGRLLSLGLFYWLGFSICGLILVKVHSLVKPTDLSKINAAFFMVNGWVGVILLAFTFLEIFVKRI